MIRTAEYIVINLESIFRVSRLWPSSELRQNYMLAVICSADCDDRDRTQSREESYFVIQDFQKFRVHSWRQDTLLPSEIREISLLSFENFQFSQFAIRAREFQSRESRSDRIAVPYRTRTRSDRTLDHPTYWPYWYE